MRYLTLFPIAFVMVVPLQAQPKTEPVSGDSTGVTKIQYVQIEQIEKDYNHLFGGQKGVLRFNFVQLKNLTTKKSIKGVEVTIETQKRTETGSSIAFATLGSIWGGSAQATYRRIRDSGYIFLSPSRLDKVVDFLDEMIAVTSQSHNKLKQWRISLQEGFELGIRYDPDESTSKGTRARPRWKFIVTASDASYTLSYQEGLDIVRKLGSWESRISGQSRSK